MDTVQGRSLNQLRRGITLVEILIVLAIIGLLVGLLLPAIQNARRTAMRVDVSNRLKQISLAHHHFQETNPSGAPFAEHPAVRGGGMVFSSLLPFIEATSIPTPNGLSIKQYQSPADPSFTAFPANEGNCSFAVNALLYGRGLVEDITDGSSNTIAFSERYARCQRQGVSWSLGEIICINGLTGQRVLCGVEFDRRANFADRSFVDVLPVTSGTPPNTTGSVPGLTFQTKPKPTDCDGRIVQGALPGGLIVALSDGSVRVLSPTIAPIVYWAAITPNGGEVLADW